MLDLNKVQPDTWHDIAVVDPKTDYIVYRFCQSLDWICLKLFWQIKGC